MSDTRWYLHCDQNWIRILKYIRTVSGRVYEDQVKDLLKKWPLPGWPDQKGDPIAFLNRFPEGCPGFDRNWDHEFLKKDWQTGGIYTVPGIRALLDPAIFSVDSAYVYNRFLYTERFGEGMERLRQEGAQVRELCLADVPALCEEGVFCADEKGIHLDFSRCSDGCSRFVLFHDFDLQEIYRAVCACCHRSPDTNIGSLNLRGLLFAGAVRLSLPDVNITLERGLALDGIACRDGMELSNLTFRFDGGTDPAGGYDWGQLSLRNARFFGDVRIRDVRLSGDTQGAEVSFEDARFAENLNIENMEFGNASLFCFQTVMGDFLRNPFAPPPRPLPKKWKLRLQAAPALTGHRLRLLNTGFGAGSRIDFGDAEIAAGEIYFENIDNLPPTSLRLAPRQTAEGKGCPRVYLLVRNCSLNNTLSISNVEQLSFLHSHNYSYIEAGSEWQPSPYWHRLWTAGPGGTPIINKLLLAVYNTEDTYPFAGVSNGRNLLAIAKARDFIMLKSNFAACNLYDEEDVAFQLYMEYKPVLNSVVLRGRPEAKAKPDLMSRVLYRFLFATGKYGVSPMRVILSLALLVLGCTGLYFLAVCLMGEGAFSLGATDGGAMHAAATVWDKLLASFLYSIEGVVPFVSQFEPVNIWVCVVTILENAMGTFLTGYFSVAVIRKTLH